MNVSGLECVAQKWGDGYTYRGYEKVPRKQSSLFFVTTEMTASYCLPDGREIVARQGDMLFLPSGLCYTVRFYLPHEKPGVDSYIVNFDLFDDEGARLLPYDTITRLEAMVDAECVQLLKALNASCHDVLGSIYERLSLFFRLMHKVSRPQNPSDKGFYIIRKGVALLQSEWAENHKMARYAEASGVSESYFRALFTRWAGMSPVEYRNHLRISHARSHLHNSAMSVAEIAALTGFEDVFYFSRAFKKVMGLSPRQYKDTSPL